MLKAKSVLGEKKKKKKKKKKKREIVYNIIP
jgi:hypothetical protein